MMKRVCLFMLVYTLVGCLSGAPPKELAEAYQAAGKNKTELEKVIRHFGGDPNDSLKLKAAVFSIQHMVGLYYFDGEQLDQYLKYPELINRDQHQGEHIMQAFNRKYGYFSLHNTRLHYDLEEVKAEDIINNIELAFRVWHEQPWGKDVTFEQFCEYVLPFRIPGAKPENNREAIYRRFNPLLDSVRQIGGDALMACAVINDHLRKEGWLFTTRPGFLPNFPASMLIDQGVGSCRDMTDLAVYVMRAVGIPVSVDIAKQWAYKSNGHMWNTVLDGKGKHHMFMCVDQNPGTTHKPGSKKGKVFRRTFSVNPHSLAMQKGDQEQIPDFFMDPRLQDVTGEYGDVVDVPVKIADPSVKRYKHAYLSVFNDRDWVPIHWGEIKKRSDIVLFPKMEVNVAYLPVVYDPYGNINAFDFPITIDSRGTIQVLKPDTFHVHREMYLDRVFPVIPDHFTVTNLTGGRFQGANQADFSDAVDLHQAKDPMPYWNDVTLDSPEAYRFVRFIPATGKRCAVGELEFFSGPKKLSGKVIGEMEPNASMQKGQNAFDEDVTTNFVSKYATGSWIGLDLGVQVRVDRIRYSAPINVRPKQKVLSGQPYELFYWSGEKGWKSVGQKEGVDGQVTFHHVPSSALYLLRNVQEEGEKRIFTYENGRQRWW